MIDAPNKSNEGSSGNVRHLDTSSFSDTIHAFEGYIEVFEEIVQGVTSTTNQLIEHWKGRGRNAFEKDCRQVQLNLKDIKDIMDDLKSALVDAHAEYVRYDSELSRGFKS